MQIEIDNNSGFCFGVQRAIELAEISINKGDAILCLGEIVHNPEEIKRLESKGMRTVQAEDLKNISNANILIRAHGAPPATYRNLAQNNNILYEGTCPIVAQLQKKIKKAWEESKNRNGQIVIFGKKKHAEVIGLMGQTDDQAILISDISDLKNIDFQRPIALFAQTTMDQEAYNIVALKIKGEMEKVFIDKEIPFNQYNTICRHVSGRAEKLKSFSSSHDTILFVSGLNSSNGKILFNLCFSINPRTYWVTNESSIKKEWFDKAVSVGICGATSTPRWLMENIADAIKRIC